ncbi:MAG TPA: pentapeptide repeat-containing protein [Candidatus Dormibacteraeota bacterium]|nr:pentapeptide repeat-containing protein [Candidatus Dormibacteraeota bacterium]
MHFSGLKPIEDFQSEVEALIAGESRYSKPGVVDFRSFWFPDGIHLADKSFTEYACFIDAQFAGPADFSRSRFVKDMNFAGAKLLHDSDFSQAIMEQRAVFARSCFRDASFNKAVFKKTSDFRESSFGLRADFGDAELYSPNFSDSNFTGSAWFGGARFFEGTSFQCAHFESGARFPHAKFFGPLSFSYSKHTSEVSFTDAVFQDAKFDCVHFASSVDFYRAVFAGLASFDMTKFQRVRFESARFDKGANFGSATFGDEAEFQDARFGCSLDGLAVADFSNVRFEKPARVWFTQVNKSADIGLRARFLNCDVEQIHLEDVRWHRRHCRMILQDEIDVVCDNREWAGKFDKSRGHELVAIVYRQLINNFDKVRSLDLAEDCYCAAMDMSRRNPHVPLLARLVLSVYKAFSLYGSSYTRALVVLFSLLLVFAWVFSVPWLGLQPAPSNPANVQMAISTLRRYPAGLVHSLEVATFQRDAAYVLPLRRGRVATISEQVSIPIQVGLLLLALRRRFRR